MSAVMTRSRIKNQPGVSGERRWKADDRATLGPNGELQQPWFVVLVDEGGKLDSIAYEAEDQDEARSWCDEWNNNKPGNLTAVAVPGGQTHTRLRRIEIETAVADRLRSIAQQLTSSERLRALLPN